MSTDDRLCRVCDQPLVVDLAGVRGACLHCRRDPQLRDPDLVVEAKRTVALLEFGRHQQEASAL